MLGRKLLIGLLTVCAIGAGLPAFGQTSPWNGQRSRWVQPTGSSQVLDSLTVLPYTIRLRSNDGTRLDSTYFSLENNELSWLRSPPGDSVFVQYRVLPFPLNRSLTLVDTTQLRSPESGIIIGSYNPYGGQNNLAGQQRLQYSGSFSRGFSFGNRQDLVLNSSFNLQMAGEIGDGIEVTAAITDENLPIQPEGNTRQLRDFDRIFIRLQKDNMQLTAGDYELQSPQGYFLQYFKKLEGATFQTTQETEQGRWNHSASIAIARGQFRRQQLVAIEGNQGPYKLQGASGERFIIVLAGTEKLFLDGRLLQRGRDADYTIDYNQGEVTFMARRLITKDSRITVEFEYADQRYLRSLYALNTHYQTDRWSAYANWYSQQDSRTSTGDLQLTEGERQLLRAAGDQLGGAFISTVDSLDAPNSQRATYVLLDTLVTCQGGDSTYQVLRFSTDPEQAIYTASFAFVGAGNGNYILDTEQTSNERVYRWVAPDSLTCVPRGDFAPVRQLAAPQLQRMFTAGGEYQLGKGGSIAAELAYSTQDLNRFSSLNADDDNGLAGRLSWNHQLPLGADSSSWQLLTDARLEYVQEDFRAINPFRSPEFLRDWNLASVNGLGSTEAAQEQLGTAGIQLQKPRLGLLDYRFSFFERTGLYSGQKHQTGLAIDRAGWHLQAKSSWLSSDATELGTKFWRPDARLEKVFDRWGGWKIALEAQAERSARRSILADTLNASSFFFERYVAQIQSPTKEKYSIGISFRQRRDYSPTQQVFQASSRADEAEIQGHWQPSASWRSTGTLTYRKLSITNTELSPLEPTETLLGRIDLNGRFWNGALRTGTTYEIGSGQEARIEYTYLFVGPGQGQYIWLDSLYNNDGKIQQNEMEISPFQDIADHVRVSIFTDDFIRTDNVTLNQSIQLEPNRIWRRSEQSWKRAISLLEWQSSLSINRKTRGNEGVQTWNALQLTLADSVLVAVAANQRHVLYFNRRSTRYDIQLEYTKLDRRLVPTTGFESRQQQGTTVRFRWNINDATTFRVESALTDRGADSEFFNNKDYQLTGSLVKPSLNIQPTQDYRVSLAYQWLQEKNKLPEASESLQRQEISLEGTYQRWLRLSASYIDIQLEGDPRSPVGFVLLNGLQPGRNVLWNASLTRPLGRFLQMTLSYEGRSSGMARTVHLGRAQVTAIF